jgi:hypothetical protein
LARDIVDLAGKTKLDKMRGGKWTVFVVAMWFIAKEVIDEWKIENIESGWTDLEIGDP